MTTIFVFFLISAFTSILATPYVGKLGRWLGAVDYPDERKIHSQVIPRCGGLAIYLAFFLPYVGVLFYQTRVTNMLPWDTTTFGFVAGSSFLLLVGLWDDIRSIRASFKFIIQIAVASFAWWSGFRINYVILPYLGVIEFSQLSLPITVFWFLAVINAMNLVDGLDGLAAGIALFASIILAVISLLRNDLLAALMFASFSGALLGFLRYNFNPASIFLGDSGSYFIGFVLAALGLATSQKSSVAVAIVIPIVALGLPLMDMVLTTIRRFVYGANIFAPDKDHIHHKLLQLGHTPRRAALVFYGITIVLGMLALLIVNARDERVGFILGALAFMSVLGIRKLGYMDYFTVDKVLGWFADLSDEAGMTRGRRTFLSHQVSLAGADNICQFWSRLLYAAEKIRLTAVSLELVPESFHDCSSRSFAWRNAVSKEDSHNSNGRFIFVELHLGSNGKHLGTLRLEKCLGPDNHDRYTLRRIEQLRRTVTGTLDRLAETSLKCPDVLQDRRCNHGPSDTGEIGRGQTMKWDGRERRKSWEEQLGPVARQ